jgi:prepilin-type N-terminal cleavage/methylation domain-containing protein/prepilin-type processing-associated H-X9-DG protein
MRSPRIKAFTLIELLVVIAIIGILAAILFPVFARARENARRVSCQSNLKQLALGIAQYIQDYDETYPGFDSTAPQNNNNNPANGLWGNMIFPYVKSLQIFKCPSAGRSRQSPGNVRNYRSHYLMNAMIACGKLGGQFQYQAAACGNVGIKASLIARTSQTILLTEGVSGYDEANTTVASDGHRFLGSYVVYQSGDDIAGYGFNGDYYGMDNTAFRKIHLDGMNMAFSDGHVKWYSEAKLLTLGVTIPFCGFKNGAKNGSVLYGHNGDIDFQPIE